MAGKKFYDSEGELILWTGKYIDAASGQETMRDFETSEDRDAWLSSMHAQPSDWMTRAAERIDEGHVDRGCGTPEDIEALRSIIHEEYERGMKEGSDRS